MRFDEIGEPPLAVGFALQGTRFVELDEQALHFGLVKRREQAGEIALRRHFSNSAATNENPSGSRRSERFRCEGNRNTRNERRVEDDQLKDATLPGRQIADSQRLARW